MDVRMDKHNEKLYTSDYTTFGRYIETSKQRKEQKNKSNTAVVCWFQMGKNNQLSNLIN